MRKANYVAVVLLAFVAAFAGVYLASSFQKRSAETKETAYARVMRTGVLRCAYGLWEPAVMRDPNTGELSGLIYDLMQEVGKSLSLKVEYSLEMPWDSIGVVLSSGKADAHCAGVFATPSRGRVMAFSHPMFFSPTVAFARADDTRFDNNLERINQPDVTVALSDDDITTEIYQRDFSKAKKWELPQFAPPEELFLALMTKKADVTFNGPSRLQSFDKGYPSKVKVIPTLKPLRIFPNTIAVNIGDQELLHVLNTAIDQMIDSGVVDKLVLKYKANYDVSFLVPVSRPYTWK